MSLRWNADGTGYLRSGGRGGTHKITVLLKNLQIIGMILVGVQVLESSLNLSAQIHISGNGLPAARHLLLYRINEGVYTEGHPDIHPVIGQDQAICLGYRKELDIQPGIVLKITDYTSSLAYGSHVGQLVEGWLELETATYEAGGKTAG